LLDQVGDRLRPAKAQHDDIDVAVAQKPPYGGRRASDDGAKGGLPLACTISQLDHTQMKAAAE
jgi:hypothetical protein